eukprot:TRINITY_DN4286_c0_g6_i1.p2 TRINITY_DN4286_c0_g6~~TRINITY_DN4286_c0_g6_i1.p2  ORF type:complete len:250 (+),score=-10.17 TRINITY_DN4286_c0_g6_i1:1335-2084(+)
MVQFIQKDKFNWINEVLQIYFVVASSIFLLFLDCFSSNIVGNLQNLNIRRRIFVQYFSPQKTGIPFTFQKYYSYQTVFKKYWNNTSICTYFCLHQQQYLSEIFGILFTCLYIHSIYKTYNTRIILVLRFEQPQQKIIQYNQKSETQKAKLQYDFNVCIQVYPVSWNIQNNFRVVITNEKRVRKKSLEMIWGEFGFCRKESWIFVGRLYSTTTLFVFFDLYICIFVCGGVNYGAYCSFIVEMKKKLCLVY